MTGKLDVAAALVGTEGTCAPILEATVRRVPSPPGRALLVLGFAGVLLLLVLIVNLASVLIARAAQREHEFAVSRAIGANGAAVVRATLFEGGLLGLGGGVIAAVASIWGTRTSSAQVSCLVCSRPSRRPCGLRVRVYRPCLPAARYVEADRGAGSAAPWSSLR